MKKNMYFLWIALAFASMGAVDKQACAAAYDLDACRAEVGDAKNELDEYKFELNRLERMLKIMPSIVSENSYGIERKKIENNLIRRMELIETAIKYIKEKIKRKISEIQRAELEILGEVRTSFDD